MLIIVEGCDGVGKTSLVEELAAEIRDAEVHHFGPPKSHPLEECILPLNTYRPGVGRHVICDRFTVGELIYGPIYRGESLLGGIDGPGHRWVDAWLRAVGGVVIHVDATLETVLERIDVRGDDYVKVEHLGEILTAYRHAVRVSLAPTRTVVCPAPDQATQLEMICNIAQARSDEARRTPFLDAGFVGNPNPSVVLVGDEPSPRHARGDRPTYRAPFVPYRDGCGWFLFGALTPGTLKRCAVVNQVDLNHENAATLAGEPDADRNRRTFVALGRAASKRLAELGIVHAVVPHPQHVRRFHHQRQADYGQLIAGVAWDGAGDHVNHFNQRTEAR